MTVADFEYMSISMIISTIIEYSNAVNSAMNESSGYKPTAYNVRQATDADYLSF